MNVRDLAASVAITDQLKEARNTVITLIGEDKFIERVEGFRPILDGLCEKHDVSKIQATIDILKTLKGKEIETLLAMAACVEIMEPSIEI